MMAEVIIKLIIWLAVWLSVWKLFYLFNKRKMNYIEKYRLTATFFFLISILVVLVFRSDFYFFIKSSFQVLPFLFLVLLFILNAMAYKYVGMFFPNYKKVFEMDSTLYFTKFDHKYLLSKSFELLYQQIMISLLVVWLAKSNFSLSNIVLIFAFIFGLGHILLFFQIKKSVALFFLIASIISSFVFPFLILKIEWGFVYSYIFHWIFYIIAGFIFIKVNKAVGLSST